MMVVGEKVNLKSQKEPPLKRSRLANSSDAEALQGSSDERQTSSVKKTSKSRDNFGHLKSELYLKTQILLERANEVKLLQTKVSALEKSLLEKDATIKKADDNDAHLNRLLNEKNDQLSRHFDTIQNLKRKIEEDTGLMGELRSELALGRGRNIALIEEILEKQQTADTNYADYEQQILQKNQIIADNNTSFLEQMRQNEEVMRSKELMIAQLQVQLLAAQQQIINFQETRPPPAIIQYIGSTQSDVRRNRARDSIDIPNRIQFPIGFHPLPGMFYIYCRVAPREIYWNMLDVASNQLQHWFGCNANITLLRKCCKVFFHSFANAEHAFNNLHYTHVEIGGLTIRLSKPRGTNVEHPPMI